MTGTEASPRVRTGGTPLRYGLFVPNAPNLIAPELFEGAGLPTVRELQALDLERTIQPEVILVLSPHFVGRREFLVQTSPRPPCLHDFGGFDPRLYDIEYLPPGFPTVGTSLIEAGSEAGLPVRGTQDHGLDHGAWAPLMHLAPHATVPVVPLSISGLGATVAMTWGATIAKALERSGLRSAFVATGSILHRLDRFDPDSSEYWEEGAVLEREVIDEVLAGRTEALTHFDRTKWATLAPEGDLEPMFVLLGAMGPGYRARVVSSEQAFGAAGLSILEFHRATSSA